MIYIKTRSRRYLDVSLRDTHGLNALDRLKINECCSNIKVIKDLMKALRKKGDTQRYGKIKALLKLEVFNLLRIVVVDVPDRPKMRQWVKGHTFVSMEAHLLNIGVSVSERFRFQSFDQLRRLLVGFCFPTGLIKLKNRYKIQAEELVMISLTRLAFPARWSDLYERFPGRKRWFLRSAFYWFLDFMITNWGYLLLNNMEYWKPSLAASCKAIRLKLMNLNWPHCKQFHPPANEPGGFRYAGFIDNTMFAFSRPGGNTDGGSAAPRVPKEIQQAWYTGWKKLHGMKWQTVILANGMDLHVFGPLSVRKNDLTSLELSKFEEQFAQLQQGSDIILKIFGDSAYFDNDYLGTGGGRGGWIADLASVVPPC
jgi:hypothetical protein